MSGSPSRSDGAPFDARDLEEIREHGLSGEEAERQISLLRNPPDPVALVAPCTAGDGIEVIRDEERDELLERWRRAARAGRLGKFVPASGAASRMFASLTEILADGEKDPGSLARRAGEGDEAARDAQQFLEGLDRLPFREELEQELRRRGLDLDRLRGEGPLTKLVAALLEDDGLGYANVPKGLVPFHERDGRAVTPVDEHLGEAAALVKDADGRCRIHFTVPPDTEESFERTVRRAPEPDATFEVSFSRQSPATDTLALDSEGRPFRTEKGRLLFRPGGHGALLRNLERLAGDLVLVKNIDNVQPIARRGPSVSWQRLLVGVLLRVQEQTFSLLHELEEEGDESAIERAARFVADQLERRDAAPPRQRERLVEILDRPLRVCGMVVVTGEPGGGPFWTRGDRPRATRQIVETAEVAPTPAQQEILGASTHFNPVLLALGVRDRKGRPFELRPYVDESRVFVSEKTWEGEPLRALEHPGLWNGSMAGWNTVFVEVPLDVFSPVKTVLDLLRPEHQ